MQSQTRCIHNGYFLLKTFIYFKSSFVTNVLFNFCFYLIMTMLFMSCLLFLSAYRTTVTVNDTISTTMILLYMSNVLTVYNDDFLPFDDDHSNNLIMNCHKSLSCNNFPTVPSRPYYNYYCTIMQVYYMLYVCVVLSIIKGTSIFCM